MPYSVVGWYNISRQILDIFLCVSDVYMNVCRMEYTPKKIMAQNFMHIWRFALRWYDVSREILDIFNVADV